MDGWQFEAATANGMDRHALEGAHSKPAGTGLLGGPERAADGMLAWFERGKHRRNRRSCDVHLSKRSADRAAGEPRTGAGVGGRSGVEPESLADAAAFRAFYTQALPVVYGYLLTRCGGGPAVAEDLTQETFMAAVRWIRSGGMVEAPLPWIVSIAKRKLIDHLRKEDRAERRLSLAWDAGRAEEPDPWSDGSNDRAIAALASVAPAQRAALALRYVDGLPVEEVARTLGKSIHATESLLVRGRESFRRALAEESS